MGKSLIYLLGYEGHKGVKELESSVKNVRDNVLTNEICLSIFLVESCLCKLDIPVAEDIPGEAVDLGESNADLKSVKVINNAFCKLVELGEYCPSWELG